MQACLLPQPAFQRKPWCSPLTMAFCERDQRCMAAPICRFRIGLFKLMRADDVIKLGRDRRESKRRGNVRKRQHQNVNPLKFSRNRQFTSGNFMASTASSCSRSDCRHFPLSFISADASLYETSNAIRGEKRHVYRLSDICHLGSRWLHRGGSHVLEKP